MLGFDASSKMSVTSGSKINHSDPTESIVRLHQVLEHVSEEWVYENRTLCNYSDNRAHAAEIHHPNVP